MKVMVSAFGLSLDDLVHERFGRSAYLLLVHSSTMVFELVDNTAAKDEPEGAGVAAANRAVEWEVEALIAGHVGAKAYSVLEAAGIPAYDGSGLSVSQAVEACVRGELPPLEQGAAPGEAHKRMPRHDAE